VRRALVLLSLLLGARAVASPPDVFGLGSVESSLGGAVAARVDGFAAGHWNPAGLSWSRATRFSVGVLGAASHLRINQEPYRLTEPVGMIVGAAAPLPLGGPLTDKLTVGVALVLLPQSILHVIARLPDEPFYPYYDNRTQRLVVLPAIAYRLHPKISVGVGLNLLAGVAGQVLAIEGPTRALEPRADEEVATRVAVNLGVRVRPHPAHDVALVFRQRFSVPFSTVATAEVAGEPIVLDLDAEGLYTPDQLVLGYSWAATAGFTLSADVTWARWSDYDGPYVRVKSELPLVGPLAGRLPAVPFSDAIKLSAGGEGRLGRLAIRGGYGFETSPVPASQPGVTNLLDGDKHILSVGLGLELPGAGKSRWRIALHGQLHLVAARTMDKTISGPETLPFDGLTDEVVDDESEPETLGVQTSNPGYPRISSGGEVFSAGLTVEVEL
jgi:hypothetical protein